MKKTHLKITLCFILALFAGISFFMPTAQVLTQKNHKFLLMLSSFKRPIFLSGQVYRLLNQSYQNFDLSISIKGSPNDYAFASSFSREFDQFKKTGKVSIRFDKNGKQLSNLLDTIRDFDIDKYDYFCKIDDDDWYASDYLKEVNRNLNLIPKNEKKYSSTAYRDGLILEETIKETSLWRNNTVLTGPTLCFSKEIIKIALQFEKEPNLVKKYLPNESAFLFTQCEDRLLDHLARSLGTHIYRKSHYPTVIYGWQCRSVIRNKDYVKFH